MKKIIRILALALVLMMLAGCTGGTKIFTCRNLTMTVPSGMKDVSSQSEFAAFTFTLDSAEMVIFALQERYDECPALEEYNLQEYAQLVAKANELSCVPALRKGKTYYFFNYTYETEDGTYGYLTATYPSEEGFWTVQICAPIGQYDEEAFFAYLDSVQIN